MYISFLFCLESFPSFLPLIVNPITGLSVTGCRESSVLSGVWLFSEAISGPSQELRRQRLD